MKREKKLYRPLCILLIAFGSFLRFYRLGSLPFGLQQDEASIGYDAFTLLRYGVDRNGYPWPVYPITWGAGGGSPLQIYLTVLSTKFLGRSAFSLRFFPALLGSLTPAVFALFPRATEDDADSGDMHALLILLLILLTVINPWHLMMSRWALDCNTLPFFLLSAVAFFVIASGNGRFSTAAAVLSAILSALCLYAYGSATIVIPLFLVLIACYTLKAGLLSVRRMLLAALVFTLCVAPLVLFYAINALGLPPVITPFFSIPILTARRSVFYLGQENLLSHIRDNIRYLLVFLTAGSEEGEMLCNYIPGYAQMYRFTFPLTFLGLFSCCRRSVKEKSVRDACFLILFFVTLLFSLFIEPDINRMTLLLIPLLWFQAQGLLLLIRKKKTVGLLTCAAILCACLLFLRDYFGSRYETLSKEVFMPGYTEAVKKAAAVAGDDKEIVSTYTRLSAPFILALYETETPPDVFLNTVVWRDETAEFRVATSFARFTFGLPDAMSSIDLTRQVLILHTSELADFPAIESCSISRWGDYAVVSR